MNQAAVPRRRWLQFSLRTLFVLMLVVAAFFGGRESMRPVIQAERAKAVRERDLAERERALSLAAAAQAEAARQVALLREMTLRSVDGKRSSATINPGSPTPSGMP